MKLVTFAAPSIQIQNSDAVPAKPFEDCLPALMLSKSFNSGAPDDGVQGGHAPSPRVFVGSLNPIPARWGRSCPPDFWNFLRLGTLNSIVGREFIFVP